MKSREECVEWFKLYTAEDFGHEFTAEQRKAVAKREEKAAAGYAS
ncbi:hypothetical protein AB0J83_47295 [Actinoplanes sp. NPDC049596]